MHSTIGSGVASTSIRVDCRKDFAPLVVRGVFDPAGLELPMTSLNTFDSHSVMLVVAAPTSSIAAVRCEAGGELHEVRPVTRDVLVPEWAREASR
jgi:hypothetical protein